MQSKRVVAKSISAINRAAGLALEGYKVLLIEVDSQTIATRVLIHRDIEIDLERCIYQSIIKLAPTYIRQVLVSAQSWQGTFY